jgi:hypothetical protein
VLSFSFLFISPLVGFLTARSASSWVKGLLAAVFSLIEAVTAVAMANKFDLANLSATGLSIMIAAGVAYKTIMGSLSDKLQEKRATTGQERIAYV